MMNTNLRMVFALFQVARNSLLKKVELFVFHGNSLSAEHPLNQLNKIMHKIILMIHGHRRSVKNCKARKEKHKVGQNFGI